MINRILRHPSPAVQFVAGWLLFLVVAGVVVSYWSQRGQDNGRDVVVVGTTPLVPTPRPFAPLTVINPLRVEPESFRPGDEVVVHDGVCNRSTRDLRIVYSLSVAPEAPSVDRPSRVVLEGERPLRAGQCLGESLRGPAQEITPGRYTLTLFVMTAGEFASEIQRITQVSPPFTVLAPE